MRQNPALASLLLAVVATGGLTALPWPEGTLDVVMSGDPGIDPAETEACAVQLGELEGRVRKAQQFLSATVAAHSYRLETGADDALRAVVHEQQMRGNTASSVPPQDQRTPSLPTTEQRAVRQHGPERTDDPME